MTEIDYARRYGYDLLRRFFLDEPTPDFLIHLKTQHDIGILMAYLKSDDEKETLRSLSHLLNTLPDEVCSPRFQALHWDHTRLFIGPERLLAPPYESYYVTKDALLFDKTTYCVLAHYTQAGFELPYREAADHIGLELDFMYHLSHAGLREKIAGNGNNYTKYITQQLNFLHSHLVPFVSLFAQRVHAVAHSNFYRQVIQFLQYFINRDYKTLQNYTTSVSSLSLKEYVTGAPDYVRPR